MKIKYLLSIFFAAIFFISGLLTLSQYGISWDEPTHFKRGQAYLRYFLTGEKDYDRAPKYNLTTAREDPRYHQRSLYENDTFNIDYYMSRDGDHPPLNGILAALFNHIFYQQLGLLGDVESYHLFEIFISSFLVGMVFLFVAESFGLWAGAFAAIFLSTYPLFWAESHFNIKDPAETAFFTAAIYFLWKGIIEKRSKFIITASFFSGFALSVKFNILFIPFIILPWLIIRLVWLKQDIKKVFLSKKILISLCIFPVIMFGIFFIVWPYLWQDPIANILSVFNYYKGIGTESGFQPSSIFDKWNSYASSWILYITPPLLLFFFVLGVISLINWRTDKKDVLLLWMLWFLVTVLRVSIPKTTIYGGVRQIMEYIPAMSMIGAVGVIYFQDKLLKLLIIFKLKLSGEVLNVCLFLLILIFSLIPLVKLHPNENVYFNFILGGLKKAVENKIPSAGNSFGNAYLQGVKWFNQNAEQNAKLALVQGTILNIPYYKIRPDIQYSNYFWSGVKREGEYMIELTFNYEARFYHYAWEYVEKMLEPVFTVEVDGVPIVKIWKNDLEHTKPNYRKTEVPYKGPKEIRVEGSFLKINLPQEVLLSRIIIHYTPKEQCVPVTFGLVETSADDNQWYLEGDQIPLDQLGKQAAEIGPNAYRYMFAARNTKFIRINLDSPSSCGLNKPEVEIVVLE